MVSHRTRLSSVTMQHKDAIHMKREILYVITNILGHTNTNNYKNQSIFNRII